MSAHKLITEHLDLWTQAVTQKSTAGRGSNGKVELTGIKKLRELILELAVRGKLVEQDPNDEPATRLLSKTIALREQLVREGKIRRQKKTISAEGIEKPFEIPASWSWATLPDVASYNPGKTPSTKDPKFWAVVDSGIPWVSIADLNHNGTIWSTAKAVTQTAADEVFRLQPIAPGTILMSFKLTVGKVSITEVPAYHNEAIISIFPFNGVSRDYLFKVMPMLALGGNTKRAIMGNTLNATSLAQILVPLPPEEEQHRIVQKVDELMALCDRLEQQTSDQLDAHETLVDTLLGTLTQSNNATELADNWARLAEHFDTLFTTDQSIDKLKQTILQLAVMGQLVEQDAGDEPVINLLKQHYITSKSCSLNGWAEVSLGNLGTVVGGSTPTKSKSEFWNGSIPWVSPKDMKFHLIIDSQIRVTEHALSQSNLKLVPENSLIMVVRGMILAHSFPVAITGCEITINQDMKALTPPDKISKYLLLYLQASKHKVVGLVDRSSHGTCKLISEKLWSLPIFLPPLEEQRRIVQKVDELMALCDQLKERLNQASSTRCQLAGAVVEGALEG
ncbi:restriction endonuclease subunit S [Halomonas sp. GFAJ-1]|uniref:restriction endonuclease subunit S n=1 Tax=Halomonas sp. GFAJ-1 TaxID=1118153 RepID=UPI00023A29C3|nr:restriction endonuclease subunit S [Halomonas sp. GFAJ-1]AVI62115.1 hypothetical protein BB497_05045 [Halomonas sp. GFAJ-1]EHK61306.1 restriction modification system DNA specificity subunit [Halomonas sp. GFAJ-1]